MEDSPSHRLSDDPAPAPAPAGLLVSLPARTVVARTDTERRHGGLLWRRRFEEERFRPLPIEPHADLRFADAVPDTELPLMHVLVKRHRVTPDPEIGAVDDFAWDSIRSISLPDGQEAGRCETVTPGEGERSWIESLVASAHEPLRVLAKIAIAFPSLRGDGEAVRYRLAEIDLATGRATSLSPLSDLPA
ncbi:MAG: hypothetical protein AAF577_07435 [Pseudomonadota bacterium]